jgi:hypothetical protein
VSSKPSKANTPDQARLERELAAERAATRAADLRWAMSNPRGRRLLFDLLYHPARGLGLDEALLPSSGQELYGLAAKRAVAKGLVDRMKAEDFGLFLQMLEEQAAGRDEVKHLRDEAGDPPDEGEDP